MKYPKHIGYSCFVWWRAKAFYYLELPYALHCAIYYRMRYENKRL